ncbi:hypothetical protein [Actinophytocola sp.]|uniref:hypothetical protein n=1 Tax=Actinophytocola sp. TaxID=1872138 RepID=UPI00389B283C
MPRSRFAVDEGARPDHFGVTERIRAAMAHVARDAGVADVSQADANALPNSRYRVTRTDGSTFLVRVMTAMTSDGSPARLEVVGSGQVDIHVSLKAGRGVVERALVNAVAQASALLNNTQTDTDLLNHATHPGGNTDLSTSDHGRQAEVRYLDRSRQETSRLRVLRRHRIAQEMKALVEELGLHPDDPVSPQRLAVADTGIGNAVDRNVAGTRRPAWVKPPDGYPKWKAFLRYHLPAEVLPGVAAGSAIAATGSPVVGAAIGSAAVVSGTAGTLIKRWYGRTDKANTDTGHGKNIAVRAYETALRRKELLDPLLERTRGTRLVDPAPVEPRPDGTMPPKYQAYWRQLLSRGGPVLGAGAATSYLAAGLPVWTAVAQWGAAALAVGAGPLVERYFRKSLVEREWTLLDNIGRQNDDTAAEFDVAFAEKLSRLLDRIDNLAGGTPAKTRLGAPPVTAAEPNNTGLHRYAAGQVGQLNSLINAGSDAIGSLQKSRDQATKLPAGGKDAEVAVNAGINSAIHSLYVGGLRSGLGLIVNAFLDQRFTRNEYKAILEQVHYDFGNKMTEQVALEHRVLTDLLDALTAEVDDAERAVGRVDATLAQRVGDVAVPAPPSPDTNPRPVGHQRLRAFRTHHVLQGLTMEGVMVGAAVAFDQGVTGVIVVGSVALTIASSFKLRYLFRHAEQVAVDETIHADRNRERPAEQAEAEARHRFLLDFFSHEIDVAAGRAAPQALPARPATPDPGDPAFADDVDALIDYERARLRQEPRPWSTLGAKLDVLNRMAALAQRVRDFHDGGHSRPERQAREDLHALRQAYDGLDNGEPAPQDHERQAEHEARQRKAAAGLRGGEQGARPAGRLRSYLDESVATPAGRAFYAAGDELLTDVADVRPEPGQYTVDMHGGEDFVRIGEDRLTADDLATLIEADPHWHGEPIRLLACETGQSANGFAQQLADRLGVTVYAPSDYLEITPDGEVLVGRPAQDSGGSWHITRPATGRMYAFEPTVGHDGQVAPLPTVPHAMFWPDRDDVRIGDVLTPAPVAEPGELTLVRDGPAVYSGADRLWPDELADIVAENRDWQGGPTRLQVRGGHVDADFAQRLADLLGVPVVVPADAVAGEFPTLSSGTLEVYNERSAAPAPPGCRVYEPRSVTAGKGTS